MRTHRRGYRCFLVVPGRFGRMSGLKQKTLTLCSVIEGNSETEE